MAKKGTKILDSKGKKKEIQRKSENADSQRASSQKKTKLEEKTVVKKGRSTNNKLGVNKKVGILNSIWSYLGDSKQNGKKKSNTGSWLS